MTSKYDGLQKPFLDRLLPAVSRMNTDADLNRLGVYCVLPVEGLRTLVVQMAYYSRWLASYAAPEYKAEALLRVQDYYRKAGLYAIGANEAFTPCTWTLDSRHFDGFACDLAPSQDGKSYWWKAPDAVWAQMCLIGHSYGLECGLDWPKAKKDPGHYELKRME